MHGSIHLFERLPQIDPRIEGSPGDPAVKHPGGPNSAPVRAKPLVGLIRNMRSHGNAKRAGQHEGSDHVLIAKPQKRGELRDILARFAEEQVDYIAIDGGDGTVRDVLTCGAGAFGEMWPALIVLPAGKTNALALDLGVPSDWSLDDALAAAARNSIARRQTLVVASREDPREQVQGFVFGGGVFTKCITLGQKSHNLGAFNSAVVGLTVLWSALQALCGGKDNAWRQGTPMTLRDEGGHDLAHRGGAPKDERYLIFASTLRQLPTGLQLFRGITHALRVGLLDNAKRSLLLRLGAIVTGRASQKTKDRGVHLFGTDAFELDIGGSFILDGEAFPAGSYRVSAGTNLRFVVP